MGEAVAEQQAGRAQKAAAQGLAPREARAGRVIVAGVGCAGIHGWLLSLSVYDIMLQRKKGVRRCGAAQCRNRNSSLLIKAQARSMPTSFLFATPDFM